jgi:hypothetical protein
MFEDGYGSRQVMSVKERLRDRKGTYGSQYRCVWLAAGQGAELVATTEIQFFSSNIGAPIDPSALPFQIPHFFINFSCSVRH